MWYQLRTGHPEGRNVREEMFTRTEMLFVRKTRGTNKKILSNWWEIFFPENLCKLLYMNYPHQPRALPGHGFSGGSDS